MTGWGRKIGWKSRVKSTIFSDYVIGFRTRLFSIFFTLNAVDIEQKEWDPTTI